MAHERRKHARTRWSFDPGCAQIRLGELLRDAEAAAHARQVAAQAASDLDAHRSREAAAARALADAQERLQRSEEGAGRPS
jgi:hypothetical protein